MGPVPHRHLQLSLRCWNMQSNRNQTERIEIGLASDLRAADEFHFHARLEKWPVRCDDFLLNPAIQFGRDRIEILRVGKRAGLDAESFPHGVVDNDAQIEAHVAGTPGDCEDHPVLLYGLNNALPTHTKVPRSTQSRLVAVLAACVG